LDLVSGGVRSEIMAIDICTFPSVRPPTILESTKTEKDLAKTHKAIDRAFPIMDNNKTFLLP
jgi:hypothetical protein